MKISQTDTQLIATQGGRSSVVGGIVLALIGIAFMIGVTALMSSPGVKATGNPALVYVFGGIFVLVGILLAVFANNRTVTLNKGGTSTVASRRIIGSKEADQSFSTADVIGVSLTTGMSNSGGGMNAADHRLSTLTLLMKDNAIIQVAISNGKPGFSINGIRTNLIQRAPLSKEANTIATFLGVPLQEANMTNPIAAVESLVGALRNPASQPIESVTTTVPPATPAVPPTAVPTTPVMPQVVTTEPVVTPLAAPTPVQEPPVSIPPTPPN